MSLKEYPGIIYAQVIRRLASFLIDTVVTNIIFVLILYLIYFTTRVDILQQFYTTYSTATKATNSLPVMETELVFGYFISFGLYVFICLTSFNKTIGMLATGIRFVTSDAQGNPKKLPVPQKFLRGFICNILAFFLLFLPAIPWPFSHERRSLIDIISKNFVIQTDNGRTRTIISYMVVGIFVLVYLYASGI